MNILSWDIRGLNNPHKKDLLANLVRDHKPDVILIQEMKMPIERLECLKKIFFKECGLHGFDVDGASGDVATF